MIKLNILCILIALSRANDEFELLCSWISNKLSKITVKKAFKTISIVYAFLIN